MKSSSCLLCRELDWALASSSLARRARRSFFSRISVAVGMREDPEDESAETPNLLARSSPRLLGSDVFAVSMRSSLGLFLEDKSRGVDGVEFRSSSRYALLYVGLSWFCPSSSNDPVVESRFPAAAARFCRFWAALERPSRDVLDDKVVVSLDVFSPLALA